MYQLKEFKNGLKFVGIPLADAPTIAILLLVKVGSRFENSDNNGLCHFIEHMMFKGTKRRPTALDISKELDGIGAEFNAFTNKEYTGYYIKADAGHLPLAVEVLSDMLLHSKFDAREIAKEKGVIIEEINMYKDNPLMYVDDLLEQLMFKGNALGYSIAGHKKNIKAIKRQDFLDYYKGFYQSQNMVLALAGNYKSSAPSLLEEKFSFTGGSAAGSFVEFKISQNKPRVALMFKPTQQVQLALGFYGCSYSDDDLPALKLLSAILGGNMSSRLFLSVREKNGLAYFIKSYLGNYLDSGNLIIQAGLDKGRIDQAIKIILQELKRLKQGINSEELQRGKDYLAGKLSLELEDTANLAQWFAIQQLMTDRILSPTEQIAKIQAVSVADLKCLAKKIIDFSRLNLAVIGPYRDKKKFERLIMM
ncbi:MAG TPA: pitrilysin family protein [bacterium]|nr:pitrilysin family protein [bacterium]